MNEKQGRTDTKVAVNVETKNWESLLYKEKRIEREKGIFNYYNNKMIKNLTNFNIWWTQLWFDVLILKTN